MRRKRQPTLRQIGRCAAAVILIAVMLAAAACSQTTPDAQVSEPPILTVAPTPTPSPTPTPTPSPTPTLPPTATPVPTVVITPKPTPNVSFEPFETDSAGKYTFPQVLVDKKSTMTGEPVYFKILTSKNVNSV